MATSALGPRVLLRRLREVMAGPEATQDRLDKISKLIAANMVAEVCSVYVLREGGWLELYATEGLRAEAVHLSKLKTGEGLVGTIAKEATLLNLSSASEHPAFKYLPETGEEIYNSFLGVPILRAGHTIGVLVVQNQASRHYSEEEEEALQTTAMVLAEVIASGELAEVTRDVGVDVGHIKSHQLTGDALADGIALGHVVLHEPRVAAHNLIAENIPDEQVRLEEAIDRLREQVDSLIARTEFGRSGEHDEVLETIRMFAYDRGWMRRMREAVETGLTAEAAVERVQSDIRARMQRQADPYLRERMHDLDDLANRLLRLLTDQTETAAQGDLPRDSIVVARNMGPAELLDYDRSKLRAVLLEEAAGTSHVAIVARALGVPAIGQISGVVDLVDTGDAIIVDASNGEVHVRPSAQIEDAYAEKVRLYARRQAKYAKLRDKPAVTRDSVQISLNINAGLLVDLPHLADSGADGIGLYRTELQFMVLQSFPRQGEQTRHYRAILEAAQDKPVVFRSLDIGSDKMLPYFHTQREENPAMGWRALRIALDRPALFRLQMRALLDAAAGKLLRVMFPMVAEVDEFLRARQFVEKERAFLAARGHSLPEKIELGAMIEVPSIVWQLDQLLPMVDFISIGSNDLMQFLYASDRGHPRLSDRYDALSPAVLSVIRQIVRKAEAHDVALNLCGEMAGNPLEAMALIGLGVKSISMAPAAIGPVKSMVLALDKSMLSEFIEPLLSRPDHSIRGDLEQFARANAIPV
ncbi:MAG: phosphoenolpyruvate--protein phosphotransferase [Aestuariivirgaceae bacterium]